MYDVAKLTGYRVTQEGTELKVFIPNANLQEPIIQKQLKEVGVWLEDGRHITSLQRKKAYATIADISLHCGYLPEECKEWLKYYYMIKTGKPYFSFATCTIDTARDFIDIILDYAIENGVQLAEAGIERTDNTDHYLYSCIKYKKCCICGKEHADLHHVDAIGRGFDRNQYNDSTNKKMSLCREHHTEYHKIGKEIFCNKYHVYGIIWV